MKDLRFWEVQALVDFMYRGEVNVTQDKLPSLLAAAEALQIKGTVYFYYYVLIFNFFFLSMILSFQ